MSHDIISALQGCRSISELRSAAEPAARSLDCDWFFIAAEGVNACGEIRKIVISNTPDPYQAWYRDHFPAADDPLTREALRSTLPIRFVEEHSQELQQFVDTAKRKGVFFFLACQQLQPGGRSTVCSFWTRQRRTDASRSERDAAVMFASCMHVATTRITERSRRSATGRQASLTDAERRCLTLLSQGVSFRRVAESLGVTQRTVTYYLAQAQDKLAAWKPKQAITHALLRGEISTADLSPRAWSDSDELVETPRQARSIDIFEYSLEGLLNRIRSASRFVELAAALNDTCIRLQCRHFAFVTRIPLSFNRAFQGVLTNYPAQLRAFAEDLTHVRKNPLVGGGSFKALPLLWDQPELIECEKERSLLRLALDSDGAACALGVTSMAYSPGGACGVLCLTWPDIGLSRLALLQFASSLVRELHHRSLAIAYEASGAPNLSVPEASCLEILACGHSQKRLAHSLSCSERAARYQVKKVAQKLGVTTSQAAVSIAVSRGMVPHSHVLTHSFRPHRRINVGFS